MDVKNKRNFILLGHASCGKTLLAESILAFTGAITRKGTIDSGNTISDYHADEIERKVSINLSLLFCDYRETTIQFIDTPGYVDFGGEVVSGLRAVDNAIVIVDAISGVALGTEKDWALLEEENMPRIIFINKLDKENTDQEKIIFDIKEHLSNNCLLLNSLKDKIVVEAVAETDDALLEKYLEGTELSESEVRAALCKAVSDAKIFPIISGSALQDKGIKELLDVIVDFLPSPDARTPISVIKSGTEETRELIFSVDSGFSAFVFKTLSDPYIGQLTLLRIFSGKLPAHGSFYNITTSTKERVGSIYMLRGKEQKALDSASCGDIVAIAKLKSTNTGSSLGEEKEPYIFSPLVFPELAISASIKPKTRDDEEKMAIALSKLTIEDKTLKVTRDPQTKEEILSGVGNLHLEVMLARLKSRFHVDVELGKPKVTLYDGSYHNVDSSDMAFQRAGAMALRKAVLDATPVLLEPIMDVEVMLPEEFMGQISGDINSRRGKVMGMEAKGRLEVVKAKIPLAEMFQYANDLKSMTGGRGAYTMKFSDYKEASQKITSTVVSQFQTQKQQDA